MLITINIVYLKKNSIAIKLIFSLLTDEIAYNHMNGYALSKKNFKDIRI